MGERWSGRRLYGAAYDLVLQDGEDDGQTGNGGIPKDGAGA